jgi:uncharacterized protein involved in outer membrane biogenesis
MIFQAKYSRLLLKTVIALLLLNVVFSIFGFLLLPHIVRWALVAQISKNLNRKVVIGAVEVNPYTLKLSLSGLAIRDKNAEDPFISLDRLYLDLDAGSIYKRSLIIRDIQIDKPVVSIIRNNDFKYNFDDILTNRAAAQDNSGASAEPKSSGFRFSFSHIELNNGEIGFNDIPMNEKHTVKDITASIPHISNMEPSAEDAIEPFLSAMVNGAYVELHGTARPFPESMKTELVFNIRDVQLRHYLAYIPDAPDIDILSGNLDADICISLSNNASKEKSLFVEGGISLENLDLADRRESRLLKIAQLDAPDVRYDVFGGRLSLGEISCKGPEVNIVRGQTGEINLLAPFPANSKEEDGKTETIVTIDELTVAGGKVSFEDHSMTEPFKTVVEPVDISLQHFVMNSAESTPFSLTLKTESGESVKLGGHFSPEPLVVEGMLDIERASIDKYAPYYSELIAFNIPEGKLDAQTHFKCSLDGGNLQVQLSGAKATAQSLKLTEGVRQDEFLTADGLSVSGVALDLLKKELVIQELAASKGYVEIMRDKDGTLNLQHLPTPAGKASQADDESAENKKERPWSVALKRIKTDDCMIYFYDETAPEPVSLTTNRIDCDIHDLSAALNGRTAVSLSFSVNGEDKVAITGEIGLSPLAANLHLDGKLDLAALRGYIPAEAQASIIKGDLSATGDMLLNYSDATGYSARYQGGVSLSDFELVGKKDGASLIAGKLLEIKTMHAGYNPTIIRAAEVILTDPYSNLVLLPNGLMNIQTLAGAEASKAEIVQGGQGTGKSAGAKQQEQDIFNELVIDRVSVKGGIIHFTDKRVQPSYWTSMDHIEGTITGFVLGDIKPANINLVGKQNGYSPLHIQGKILPVRKNLLVDVNVKFDDVDMVQMNPYSRGILGHNIHKGKASLNLRYLIDKNKLDSQNIVVIDNITLGNQVESPDAIDLPIKAAIAVMKNRNGEIHLDVPIRGDLNDPTFSLRKIIVNFLYSLIKKIATAPFAFLGLPFGGGEELRYLEFDYASGAVSEQTRKKLDILVQVINDRPNLDIELEGHVDLEQDREALKQYLLHRKIQQQKFREMIEKGLPVTSVEEIVIKQDERNRYLKMAYQAETFQKPKNMLGLEKSLSYQEMEGLILQNLTIGDEDLRLLALKRAIALRDYLSTSGGVDPGRIYLVEPESLAPQKQDDLRDSRVDIRLR